MRIIKLLICFILMLLLPVTGCQFTYKYELMQSSDEIVKISIVFLDDGEIFVRKELSPEAGKEFLSEILGLSYYKYWNDPSTMLAGDAAKISYSNGDYEIISTEASAYFKGDHCRYIYGYFDRETFKNVFAPYIDQKQNQTEALLHLVSDH